METASSLKYLVQNIVVLAGLLFSGYFVEPEKIAKALFAYVLLSLLSFQHFALFSRARLKNHHHFPSLPLLLLHALAALLMVIAAFLLHREFGILCLIFLIIRYSYLLYLHGFVLFDVGLLPMEMAIKGAAGSAAIGAPQSGWGLVSIFLLALLVSLGRLKNRMLFAADSSHVSVNYTPKLLNEMMAVVSSSTLIAYCLYAISPETSKAYGSHSLLITLPFVLYGLFRFIWIINYRDCGDDIEALPFKDLPMAITIVAWTLVVMGIFLLFRS